jgi:hypothetical protein
LLLGASRASGAGPGFPFQFLTNRMSGLLRDFHCNPLRGQVRLRD